MTQRLTLTLKSGSGKDAKVFLANYEFTMGYDFILKRWHVSGCGGQVVFRAPANVSVLQERTQVYVLLLLRNRSCCPWLDTRISQPYSELILSQSVCSDISNSFAKCRNAEKVDCVEAYCSKDKDACNRLKENKAADQCHCCPS
ncbi:hypothetical protein Btru_031055 [Bulinus truncatus]|nr:hypothetical protein Btru_031055 [Bulinus truncatus]